MSEREISPGERSQRQALYRALSDASAGKPLGVVIAALTNSLADAICQATFSRDEAGIAAVAVSRKLQANVRENYDAAAAQRAAAREGGQADG